MQSLHEILDELGPRLYVMLTRLTLSEHTAEDLLQELFLKLNNSEDYVRAENPQAYIYRVAVNLAFDWRRSCLEELKVVNFQREPAIEMPSPLAKLIQAEDVKDVLEVVGRLSEPFREILVRRYIQQESYEDIASELNRPIHQIRALCCKGLNQARINLGLRNRFNSGRKREHE